MFAVCVLQVVPQLEKLLKLPVESLTKEIKLTQDLIELLIEYQIPSDLLACDLEDPNGMVIIPIGLHAGNHFDHPSHHAGGFSFLCAASIMPSFDPIFDS